LPIEQFLQDGWRPCSVWVLVVVKLFPVFLRLWPAAVHAIELIDYGGDLAETNYARIIQTFHRFLVDHLVVEDEGYPNNPSLLPPDPSLPQRTATLQPIAQLLGMYSRNAFVCTYCKAVREKAQITFVIDLIYPRKVNHELRFVDFRSRTRQGSAGLEVDLASVLQASLFREISLKTNCQNCKVDRMFDSTRFIATSDLPPILAVNANVFSEEHLEHWLDSRRQRFLTPFVELRGQVNDNEEPIFVTYNLRVSASYL
jgi:Ubiquitin carboxyl-terminal hydrolase